jgi:hypothetical protein
MRESGKSHAFPTVKPVKPIWAFHKQEIILRLQSMSITYFKVYLTQRHIKRPPKK